MTDGFGALQAKRLSAFDKFFARSPLRLTGEGKGAVAAWFLGPKAENGPLLRDLALQAIEKHLQARRKFHPGDPKAITAGDRRSRDYKDAVAELYRHADNLFSQLQLSAPVWSMRHQGHMLWDQVLPAIVGYFGAMLYNQNNVAAEASPLTTWLEIEVGNDLCRLLGFDVVRGSDRGARTAWGHITCDGSVANIEGLWAARNAKFLPLALRAALRGSRALAPARALKVRCPGGGEDRLVDLDTWTLLNLDTDDIADLPHRIENEFDIPTQVTIDALSPIAAQNVGMIEFHRRHLPKTPPPVAFAPATCHYSWPKAGTLLGLGQNNIVRIRVDLEARLDVGHLRQLLESSLVRRQPVIAVVAVIGSTEESAVDPLREILRVRDEFRRKGLNFSIHCDAAWGGFFRAMLRHRSTRPAAPARFDVPSLALSPYVAGQLAALKEADSITIDPHKAGYVPYPAGALCYRNSAMRDLVSLKAPVVFHSASEPTVGIYGIEGSKPGAAAAGVYLAHKVIRPTESGYGKILGQCVWTSTRLYCRLVTMKGKRFKIVLLQMLPAERRNEGRKAVERQKQYIRNTFVKASNADLERLLHEDADANKLFSELGSDLVILAYSFNYVLKSGRLNRNPKKLAALNNEIFKICSVTKPMQNPNSKRLIVTNSSFNVAGYGRKFMRYYCSRLGVRMREDVAVPFLISTTMDPWTTDTPQGDFLEVVENALRAAVNRAIRIVDG